MPKKSWEIGATAFYLALFSDRMIPSISCLNPKTETPNTISMIFYALTYLKISFALLKLGIPASQQNRVSWLQMCGTFHHGHDSKPPNCVLRHTKTRKPRKKTHHANSPPGLHKCIEFLGAYDRRIRNNTSELGNIGVVVGFTLLLSSARHIRVRHATLFCRFFQLWIVLSACRLSAATWTWCKLKEAHRIEVLCPTCLIYVLLNVMYSGYKGIIFGVQIVYIYICIHIHTCIINIYIYIYKWHMHRQTRNRDAACR